MEHSHSTAPNCHVCPYSSPVRWGERSLCSRSKSKARLQEVKSVPKVTKISHSKLNTGVGIGELQTTGRIDGSRGCHWAPAGLGLSKRNRVSELLVVPLPSLHPSPLVSSAVRFLPPSGTLRWIPSAVILFLVKPQPLKTFHYQKAPSGISYVYQNKQVLSLGTCPVKMSPRSGTLDP